MPERIETETRTVGGQHASDLVCARARSWTTESWQTYRQSGLELVRALVDDGEIVSVDSHGTPAHRVSLSRSLARWRARNASPMRRRRLDGGIPSREAARSVDLPPRFASSPASHRALSLCRIARERQALAGLSAKPSFVGERFEVAKSTLAATRRFPRRFRLLRCDGHEGWLDVRRRGSPLTPPLSSERECVPDSSSEGGRRTQGRFGCASRFPVRRRSSRDSRVSRSAWSEALLAPRVPGSRLERKGTRAHAIFLEGLGRKEPLSFRLGVDALVSRTGCRDERSRSKTYCI